MADSEEYTEQLESTLDVEIAPLMGPPSALSCAVPSVGATPKNYWQAHNFSSRINSVY
jgi:hypothetical protein